MSDHDRISELSQKADDLIQVVGKLAHVQRVNRWHKIAFSVLLALDLALTVALATVLNGQADQNHKIKQALAQNYTTSQQQQQTRVEVLCPLYQLLVSLAEDPNRTAGMTPEQKLKSDAAAQSLEKQYSKLKCTP